MVGIERLPEPKDIQKIKEIFQRHEERTSNISPIIKICEALIDHFSTFTSRELDDIYEQIELLEPWFQIAEEKQEYEKLVGDFERLRANLQSLVDNAKKGEITGLENFDIDIIVDVFKTIDSVEELWSKIQKWSYTLFRQGELFRHWLEEMLPRE